jgi:predicted amidophosphoribosyltransferase
VQRCRECAGRRLAFTRARAAVAYDETARRVVAAWKEHAVRGLGRWAVEAVATGIPPPSVDRLTFVPPDRERQLKRSVHPAEALARALANRWRVEIDPLLRRGRRSARQRGLSRQVRTRNVSGAFEPTGAIPRRVALVDDVYTTGATVNAAAAALRKGGARHVEVVTFARALRVR